MLYHFWRGSVSENSCMAIRIDSLFDQKVPPAWVNCSEVTYNQEPNLKMYENISKDNSIRTAFVRYTCK